MSSQVEGLNPGPLDYKSGTLTTRPGCLLLLQDQKQSLQDWSQPARQASEKSLRDQALKLFLPKTCWSLACLHHCWLRIGGFCHSCIMADKNLLKGNSHTCSHTMHQKCRLNCKSMSHSDLVQVDPSERNYKMTHSLIFNYSIMTVWCLFSLLLAPCSCWRGTHIWFLWRDCGQVLQSWWGRNIDCPFSLSA